MPHVDYVAEGHFDDATWRAAAAKPAGKRTEVEALVYAAGPRPHPYGPGHVAMEVDGKTMFFRDQQNADAHMSMHNAAAEGA